jgi:parallel beta-helix repeat protein
MAPTGQQSVAVSRHFATALLALVLACGCMACASASAAPCRLVAATSGSDRSKGTLAHPLRTVQRLADKLKSGQVGCVRGGVYQEDLRINHGGRSAAKRLTIQSYGGERATLVGRVYIPQGSNHVTIAQMNLNGRNDSQLPSPTINSEDAVFSRDDVTNEHTGICFILGSTGYGRAVRTIIDRNRIHDCGVEPSHNQDHGIYLSASDGVRITGNVIFKNVDRGIQLFPDAQGTVIEHNVIDGNGEGVLFSGDSATSSNTRVESNLITNSKLRYDVESFYPHGTPAGANNILRNNCVFGGAQGTIGEQKGYTATLNKAVNPQYANPAAGNFSIPPGNRCARYVAAATPLAHF